MLRRFRVLTITVLTAAAFAATAAAGPTKSPQAFIFPATCDGEAVEFAVMGQGAFSPGHVVGSTSVFLPYAFDITFTFTPEGGTPMTEREEATKPAPATNPVTCSINFTATFPGEGTLSAVGTATGFFTPRS